MERGTNYTATKWYRWTEKYTYVDYKLVITSLIFESKVFSRTSDYNELQAFTKQNVYIQVQLI